MQWRAEEFDSLQQESTKEFCHSFVYVTWRAPQSGSALDRIRIVSLPGFEEAKVVYCIRVETILFQPLLFDRSRLQ
jgi:hypothetical protein